MHICVYIHIYIALSLSIYIYIYIHNLAWGALGKIAGTGKRAQELRSLGVRPKPTLMSEGRNPTSSSYATMVH